MLSLPSAEVGWGGTLPVPLRSHIPFSVMCLRSALEADVNLGSLLPARCCCKAHMSTGSSTYSISSSDLYIVIRYPRIFRLWEFLIVHLCFGTVIVDEESLPSGCSCFGVGFFVVPPSAGALVCNIVVCIVSFRLRWVWFWDGVGWGNNVLVE